MESSHFIHRAHNAGNYVLGPEYDNPFIKKEIEALLERMGAESIEDLMFTAEGDMGTNSALYLQPEGEQSSSVTRVFIKTGEEWRNVPPLDFPVLHTVGYYMYVPINTESYTGKISEVQLHEGSPAVIRNTDQCVVITKEAFDIITQDAQITIVGNSVATISSVIITQGTNTTSWPESGWKEIDGTDATVTVTGTDLNADNL